MTFVIGFNSSNGLVLCTDSLETDGLTKRAVDKIKFAGTVGTNGWSVAIAGAGPGGLLDKFVSEAKSALPRGGSYVPKAVENAIESTLSRFKSKYEEPFRIIVGVCGNVGMERFLYRSDENYLVPVIDHAHIGMGHSLWRFFTEMLYEYGNSALDNARLAVFIMRQAINYVDGVDKPIQVTTYTFGDDFWKFKTAEELEAIESDFNTEELKTALHTYWRVHNPPSLREQLLKYGCIHSAGDELTFLDGVKVEELQTVSGRKRALRIFDRNRDRLLQRATLERERISGQMGNKSQLPPSDRKTHT